MEQADLETFIKIRAALDPHQETVFWWTGRIYAFIPGQKAQLWFDFEGYNIARALPCADGYALLTREASFYQTPNGGPILEHWTCPLSGQTVEVIHVWNDPVNQHFPRLRADGTPFALPLVDLGMGDLCLPMDVFLAYPSPLPRAQFMRYSAGDLYQGGELFQFFVRQAELADPTCLSVPALLSWTRIGPWLPWMELGDTPGWLIYQCRGKKLSGGYAALPEPVREYVEAHAPQFATAPWEDTGENETSWTYFLRQLKGGTDLASA